MATMGGTASITEICRCRWCNLDNPRYVAYHDSEWGVPVHDDTQLFEMLLLESFQAGLSWECVLNKREPFRRAFNNFDYRLIATYDEAKKDALRQDEGIVRNRLKINAAVINAQVFMNIQKEWNSFNNYLWHFSKGQIIRETGKANSPLSDEISADLKRRGMKFVGTTIIYAYLQAVGIVNSHEKECFRYNSGNKHPLHQ